MEHEKLNKQNLGATPTSTQSSNSKMSEKHQNNNPYSVTPKTENEKIQEGIEPINGTPFISTPYGEGYAIALGRFIVGMGYKTREEAEKTVQGYPWDIILTAANVINNEIKKQQ